MKKLLLIIFISINLFARLNPFEPSQNQIKKEPIKVVPIEKNIDDGKRTVKIVSDKIVKKPIVKIKTKIIEKKLTKEQLAAQCVRLKKDMIAENNRKREEAIARQIAKQEAMIKNFKSKLYNVLPFFTIESNLDNIIVSPHDKYKLIRYFFKENHKKIVFDFKGKVRTSTRYKNFEAPYFHSYTIGNHSKDNFFRVVIKTKKDMSKYKVTIKDNIATINYNK